MRIAARSGLPARGSGPIAMRHDSVMMERSTATIPFDAERQAHVTMTRVKFLRGAPEVRGQTCYPGASAWLSPCYGANSSPTRSCSFREGPLVAPRELVAVSRIEPSGRTLRQQRRGVQRHTKSPPTITSIGSMGPQGPASETPAATTDRRPPFVAYALLLIALTSVVTQAANAASLQPTTSKAWEAYVESANKEITQRLSAARTFLWADEEPNRLARIRAGEIVVSPVGPEIPKRVPSGLIHHWIGAVFMSHVKLEDVLRVVRDYSRYKDVYKPAVADSKVITSGNEKDRFSMRLVNKSWIRITAYDIDFESYLVHLDDRHVYGVSRATRIQEIEAYGAAAQHTLNENEGSGIIWRLWSTSRYLERDGGVYIELEALALSRDIPRSLRWLVEPIVRHVSRVSLSTSLRQTQKAVSTSFATSSLGRRELTLTYLESNSCWDRRGLEQSWLARRDACHDRFSRLWPNCVTP